MAGNITEVPNGPANDAKAIMKTIRYFILLG